VPPTLTAGHSTPDPVLQAGGTPGLTARRYSGREGPIISPRQGTAPGETPQSMGRLHATILSPWPPSAFAAATPRLEPERSKAGFRTEKDIAPPKSYFERNRYTSRRWFGAEGKVSGNDLASSRS